MEPPLTVCHEMLSFLRKTKRTLSKAVKHALYPPGPAVLIYHYVGSDNPFIRSLGIRTSLENFEQQIRFLKEHYAIIPFSEVSLHRREKNAVALTFDDGYRCLRTEVLPVLEKYGCPFKIFLNSAQVSGGLSWLNKLSVLLNVLNQDQIRNLAESALDKTGAGCEYTAYDFWNDFIPGRTDRAVCESYDKLADGGSFERLYLSAQDVKEIASHPLIEWGSHGMHHIPLDKLDQAALHQEIVGGHAALKEILGARLDGFAVPFGSAKFRTEPIADVVRRVDRHLVLAAGGRVTRRSFMRLEEIDRISIHDASEARDLLFAKHLELLDECVGSYAG